MDAWSKSAMVRSVVNFTKCSIENMCIFLISIMLILLLFHD